MRDINKSIKCSVHDCMYCDIKSNSCTNKKIRIEDGPDNNVPHFYADPQLIYELFSDFDILDVRQIEKIEQVNDQIKKHHHYHVLAKKR